MYFGMVLHHLIFIKYLYDVLQHNYDAGKF